MPRTSTRNQRRYRAQQARARVGELGVEAELVDLVVAGEPRRRNAEARSLDAGGGASGTSASPRRPAHRRRHQPPPPGARAARPFRSPGRPARMTGRGGCRAPARRADGPGSACVARRAVGAARSLARSLGGAGGSARPGSVTARQLRSRRCRLARLAVSSGWCGPPRARSRGLAAPRPRRRRLARAAAAAGPRRSAIVDPARGLESGPAGRPRSAPDESARAARQPRPRTKSGNASRVVYRGSRPSTRRIRVVSSARPNDRKRICSRREVDAGPPQEGARRTGHRLAGRAAVGPAGQPGRLASSRTPSPATLTIPVVEPTVASRSASSRVVLVHELQPGVEADHGRHDGQAEVVGERGADAGADDVREPQQHHVDVGPAAGEPAHVPLDLDGVLAPAAAGEHLGAGVLGEHRRGRGSWSRRPPPSTSPRAAARSAAFWQAASSCIVPMTLISFMETRPPALRGGGDDVHVDDGVDLRARDHLRDHGVADVGAHEVRRADVVRRRDDVDADDAVDAGRRR